MLQSNRTLVSLVSLLVAAPLVGCAPEMDEQDEFVAEEAQALTAEICNGVDDDEDFMIDEDNVCIRSKYVHDNHEYIVVQNQLVQAKAQATCQGRGMNLVRIGDAAENAVVQSRATRTPGLWIDTNDRASEGSYRYEDGSLATWFHWGQCLPNNVNNEDCAILWDSGDWDDVACGLKYGAGCELLDPITWNDNVNVSIVGTKLTKTGGMSWDAGAKSVQKIESGEGFVQFTTDDLDGLIGTKALGLTSDPQGTHWETMDYAILLTQSSIQIWENGGFSPVSVNGSWMPGDVFRIEIAGGEVRYLRNGALMSAHVTTPTYPLYADAVLGGDGGASLGDARLHACHAHETSCIVRNMWTRTTNVLAINGRVKKVFGGSWDAGASTIASVSSNAAYAQFSAPADGSKSAAGFGLPHSTHNLGNVKYGILFGQDSAGNPIASAIKDGNINFSCAATGPVTVHSSNSDVFRVELIGTNTVVYKKNGVGFCTYTAPTPHPTSVHLDVTISSVDAEINHLDLGTL